ncbi:MAG: hypothetical protein WD492_12785 [Alkalispirochaeta sp.]
MPARNVGPEQWQLFPEMTIRVSRDELAKIFSGLYVLKTSHGGRYLREIQALEKRLESVLDTAEREVAAGLDTGVDDTQEE